MFWFKSNGKKEERPHAVSGAMSRLIGEEWRKLPPIGDHWAEYLAVMRPKSEGSTACDVRIFSKWAAEEKKLTVANFSSLDDHPDLILLEGWFDKKTKKGEIKATHPELAARNS